MSDTDTSAEVVERLAVLVAPLGQQSGETRWQAAVTLRALRAERDEALADWKSEMDMHRDEHRRRIQAEAERDRLREALRLTAMLFEQIMIAIDADPAETFLSVKIQPNGAEVKRITVAECLDKARAALGIEEPAHD